MQTRNPTGTTGGGVGGGTRHFDIDSLGAPYSRGPGGADTSKKFVDKKLASLDQHMHDGEHVFTWVKNVRNKSIGQNSGM